MNELIYGKLKFSRASIPDFLSDLAAWPNVDPMALDERARAVFLARREAIRSFIEDTHLPVAQVLRDTGLLRATLYRLIERCWRKHPDGRIYGFRAAIPYARLSGYERKQPVDPDREGYSGCSGAFSQLLRDYPAIEKLLKKLARNRIRPIKGKKTARQIRKPLLEIHEEFIKACLAEKIRRDQYPFTERRKGFRSLQTHLKKMAEEEKFSSAVTNAGGLRAGAAPSDEGQAPAATRPFEVVEFDGHKLHARLTIRQKDPLGHERLLELNRIWILVLLDVNTRAVLGYSIALGKEYNKDDVAAAMQSAMTPFVPRKYTIPGLQINEGGGFPSSVLPETAYACWDWFRIDGAKSHLATATLQRLTQVIGCWTDNGPAGEPDARPFIERFFQLLAEHFAHRLPGTLGSDPEAIEKALGDPGGDLSLLIEYDELVELIEVVIANYNGAQHGGILGVAPLESMRQSLRRCPRRLRTLPRCVRSSLCLLQEATVVPIRGSLLNGVRPHINFSNVKYTSRELGASPALIGKKLRIYYDVRDIRTVRAFFEDGSELGVLTAARPWNEVPHALRLRQQIFREIAEGKLVVKPGQSPIEAWEQLRWSEARKNKRAANALAQARVNGTIGGSAAVTKQSKPDTPASDPAPASAPSTPTTASPVGERTSPPAAPASVPAAAAEPTSSSDVKPDHENSSPQEVPVAQPRPLKIRRTVVF